jgi:hypothetical protein
MEFILMKPIIFLLRFITNSLLDVNQSSGAEQAKQKAKSFYEQIIFHHEDSIYFTDARKKYRQLRGDTNL